MRRLSFLLPLVLVACAEVEFDDQATNSQPLATIAGSVFGGEMAPEGEFVLALVAVTDGTIAATTTIDADELPLRYEFAEVSQDIQYHVVAFDADVEVTLASTQDPVRVAPGDDRMDGINLALR